MQVLDHSSHCHQPCSRPSRVCICLRSDHESPTSCVGWVVLREMNMNQHNGKQSVFSRFHPTSTQHVVSPFVISYLRAWVLVLHSVTHVLIAAAQKSGGESASGVATTGQLGYIHSHPTGVVWDIPESFRRWRRKAYATAWGVHAHILFIIHMCCCV